MLGARLKMNLMLAGAIILAVLGIYAAGVWRGVERTQARIDTNRLKAMRKAKGVEDEINALGTDALRQRARRWVREPR